MAFIKLEGYLKKFLDLAPKKDLSPQVYEFIKKTLPYAEFNLKVKNKTIYFYDLNFSTKNEIFLRRNEILSGLKQALGVNAPTNINFQKF
ncbi:hypothetical protein HYT00_03335 [Candidatus Giovannonibacteria bacterium]|nr:hypothetical protein [Candidatus Giovannonibacteria bacterium]